jgi:hypothetical protein
MEYLILGRTLGAIRPRGWVRPGLTVHLAKYDRRLRGEDVGCYHVLRDDGVTLCGHAVDRPNWRDAGWADSEIICCKHCGDRVWRRWLRDGACEGVNQTRPHTLDPADDWVSRLTPEGRAIGAASTTGEPDAQR